MNNDPIDKRGITLGVSVIAAHVGTRLVFMTCWWMWDVSLTIKIMTLAAFVHVGLLFAMLAFLHQSLSATDVRLATLTRDLLASENRDKKGTNDHLMAVDKKVVDFYQRENYIVQELGLSATCFGASYLIAHFLFL